MHSAVVRFSPEEWSSAWRPEAKRLLVALPGAPVARQRVAVRVELVGHVLHATVLGTVARLQRTGASVKADVEPDPASLGAIALFDAAARGQVVRFRDRPRRWLARLAVSVLGRNAAVMMTTANVSPGGCSLRWSGEPPKVNQTLRLRFGMGLGSTEVEGSVRWVRGGTGTAVGIHFCDPRSASLLGPLLASVARTQPPTV